MPITPEIGNELSQKILSELSVDIDYVEYLKYDRKIDRNLENTATESSRKYIEGNVVSNPKIEKDSDKPNFVSILSKPEYKNARKLITSDISSWLFEILEQNPDTVDKVDLTKVLINAVLEKDKFKVDFDFNIYDKNDFITVTGGAISYETLNLTDNDLEILYKITSAERGDGTQEQQEYVVSVILNRVLSSNFPNTVYDVVFAPMQFQPTRNGAYEKANPSDITKAAVNNVVKTGDKTGGAVYFMTPGAALEQHWLENCQYLFNDVNEELRYTNTGGSHNFYTKDTVLNELQQYATLGNGSLIDSAISIHKYVRENGYRYEQKGIYLPNITGNTIDCSSYVTWVLINSGIEGFTEGMYQWTSVTFNSNPYGWQEVSVDEAKAGDIAVYNGHVEIIAAIGENKFIVYNCGGSGSINSAGTTDLPESSTSGYTKSKITKILRVP